MDNALRLVARNQVCGRINGQRLRDRAPAASNNDEVPIENVVLRIASAHNDEKCAKRPCEQFRQLRQATFLCVAAPVMLTQNHIWGVQTVPLGLMNGARGIVIAVVYNADTSVARIDGTDGSLGFPDGRASSPLPEFVVVHFPGYRDKGFFKNCPRTWIPIPSVAIRNDRNKRFVRVGLPLRLCWALTIHKAQGLSCEEGVIVDLTVEDKGNPVATAGLAFVAWTRATEWPKMAIRSLPSLGDFLAVRQTADFKRRAFFETWADEAHDKYLREERGIDEKTMVERHIAHFKAHVRDSEQREASPHEVDDLKAMLAVRGVREISPETLAIAARRLGTTEKPSLVQIVAAFRGKRHALGHEGLKGKRNARSGVGKSHGGVAARTQKPESTSFGALVQPMLEELGFEQESVEEAKRLFGPNLQGAVEFCLATERGEEPNKETQ